jgi:D-alanyl-D-alanine carboxypeptidase (penicillin-binding protein 5/6)
MKGFRLTSYALFVLLTALGIILQTPSFSDTTPRQSAVSLPETDIQIPAITQSPGALSLTAKYACLMDSDSCRVLYGKEADQQVAMASTTKIMTLLLALEYGKMEETVTASSYAASMPKVHLGMSKGYQYRLEDLLYSLMLESHNDTAVAIAEHIGGSVENFAALMNAKAEEIGLTQTHFVTPNGLDNPEHYSTASDMCRLAAYAIQNEDFCRIIQTKTYQFTTIDGKHSYSLSNKDAFLSYYDGALGIKTGFTGNAGYCFVGAARRGEITLTSCVLACGWPPNKSAKWSDTKNLMDYGFSNYTILSLPLQDLTQVRIPVEDGKANFVSCRQPDEAKALTGSFESLRIVYDIPETLIAPVDKNTPIGTVSYYIGDTLYEKEEIFPSESIEKSCFSDTIRNVFYLWMESFGA